MIKTKKGRGLKDYMNVLLTHSYDLAPKSPSISYGIATRAHSPLVLELRLLLLCVPRPWNQMECQMISCQHRCKPSKRATHWFSVKPKTPSWWGWKLVRDLLLSITNVDSRALKFPSRKVRKSMFNSASLPGESAPGFPFWMDDWTLSELNWLRGQTHSTPATL
jgi:hypothetical protein